MLPRGVSESNVCEDVLLELPCMHSKPQSVRRNAGDEIAADTSTASEADSKQNMSDRMPNLMRLTYWQKEINTAVIQLFPILTASHHFIM